MSSDSKPFVIARRWHLDQPFHPVDNCCIYTYGSQIQHGTVEEAQRFLSHVRVSRQDSPKAAADYDIYWLDFTVCDRV